MLELEDGGWDVKDVAHVVDDMEATDCSGSLVQREGSGGRERLDNDPSFKVRIDGGGHDAGPRANFQLLFTTRIRFACPLVYEKQSECVVRHSQIERGQEQDYRSDESESCHHQMICLITVIASSI